MRVSCAGIMVFCVLLVIAAGFSPALAQSLPAPTPLRPLTNGIPDGISVVPGSDALSVGDGARVAFTHVANATHYDICLRIPSAGACFNQNTKRMFAFAERVNASIPVSPNGKIEFFVPIPDDRQGSFIDWGVAACTGPNPTQCGNFAQAQRVLVLLPQATIPPNLPSTIPNNRSVTFQWNNHFFANEFPQLIVMPDGLPAYQGSMFSMANPTVASSPGQSIAMQSMVNSHTMTLPTNMGPAIKWAVANCRNFPGKGRRCSQLLTSWRSMRVANFFSTVVAPTFLHPRCVNCHAVTPDNFQNDPPSNGNGGLPNNHPAVNAASNCAQCHTNNLLPAQGTINPGWHAAPGNMDFRRGANENAGQHIQRLCSMAQQTTGAGSGYQHLTQDKLILWAVNPNANGNVQLPGGPSRQAAPPANITAWQNEVYVWWHKTQKACD